MVSLPVNQSDRTRPPLSTRDRSVRTELLELLTAKINYRRSTATVLTTACAAEQNKKRKTELQRAASKKTLVAQEVKPESTLE